MRVFSSVHFRRVICSFALSSTMISGMMGCGSSGEDDKFKGDRGTVSGKITYKGAPVPAGTSVVFQSKTGGYSAGAATNAAGEYTLNYAGSSKLPAVVYVVGVSPPRAPEAKPDPSKMATSSTEAPKAEAPPALPAKYNSATTSGLEFTVKGGANKADFELTD